MDKENEKALTDLLLENYEAASIIVENFDQTRIKILEGFREQVFQHLIKSCNNSNMELKVTKGDPVNSRFSQIWISKKGDFSEYPLIGLETFSFQGHFDNKMFVGLFLGRDAEGVDFGNKGFNPSGWWLDIASLQNVASEAGPISLVKLMSKINVDEEFRIELIESIASQVIDYVKSRHQFIGQDDFSKKA